MVLDLYDITKGELGLSTNLHIHNEKRGRIQRLLSLSKFLYQSRGGAVFCSSLDFSIIVVLLSSFLNFKAFIRIPTILTKRKYANWFIYLLRVCTKNAHAVIVQSEDSRKEMMTFGVSSSRLFVLNNWKQVEPEVSENTEVGDVLKLLYISRRHDVKRWYLLNHLVSILDYECEIDVYGPDFQLTDFSGSNCVRINLKGFEPRLDRCVQHYDAVLQFSLVEGFPNSVLLAMSAGVPLVSLSCPGGTRELASEINAEIVENVEGFPGAIKRVRKLSREDIRNDIEVRFSRKVAVQLFKEIIQK